MTNETARVILGLTNVDSLFINATDAPYREALENIVAHGGIKSVADIAREALR